METNKKSKKLHINEVKSEIEIRSWKSKRKVTLFQEDSETGPKGFQFQHVKV